MDAYINAAVEQFRELLCQQAARQERMEKNAPAKDFSRAEKTVIGVIGGDGIGPIIMAQAASSSFLLATKRRRFPPINSIAFSAMASEKGVAFKDT